MRALALLSLLVATPAWAHGAFHDLIAVASARVVRTPDVPAFLARAELYREHGDFQEALADLGEAAQRAPLDDGIELLRGRTLVDANRPHMAKTFLDRYVERHPQDPTGLWERARAHQAMFARDAAADDYQRALALLPAPGPDQYLQRMRAQQEAGRSEAALGGLDEGVARLGPLVSLELPAIELELAARRFDEALARLALLAAQSSRQESFHARRGEILLLAGRRAQARAAFQAAEQAIAALPPYLRATAATAELAAKVRRQLGRR
jgi:predicted Zn-dependent protease